jgi:hypothetical protein
MQIDFMVPALMMLMMMILQKRKILIIMLNNACQLHRCTTAIDNLAGKKKRNYPLDLSFKLLLPHRHKRGRRRNGSKIDLDTHV